jgi:chromosome partitioning protein
MKIVIASGKGGVGKSTLSLVLVTALRASGHKVKVIDKDPQGTLTRGLEANGGLGEGDASIHITDTMPRHEHLEEVIREADLALIPCSPDVSDFWATTDMLPALQDVKAKLRLVWNKIRPGTNQADPKTLKVMEDKLGLPKVNATLGLRAVYAQTLPLMGWNDLPASAKLEATALALAVLSNRK